MTRYRRAIREALGLDQPNTSEPMEDRWTLDFQDIQLTKAEQAYLKGSARCANCHHLTVLHSHHGDFPCCMIEGCECYEVAL
jgi:hypothetical protein